MDEILFREEQKPRQWWVQLLVIAYSVFITYEIFKNIVYSIPIFVMGVYVPPSVAVAVWFLLGVLVPVLYYRSKLLTEVRQDGLYIRYVPFHNDFALISFEDIESIEEIEYDPIKDYGGWGIRYGAKGNALNAYGNKGVLLNYKEKRSMLIGSQKSKELADVLNKLYDSIYKVD